MYKKAAIGIFAVVFIFSCRPAEKTELSEIERAAIADTVTQLARAKFNALLNLDIDSYAGTMSSDIVMAGDGGYLNTDYEALIKSNRAGFENFESMTGKIDISNVEVLGPNAAVLNWKVELAGKKKDGKEFSHAGLVTAVLAQKNGVWKIIREHESGYRIK